MQTADHDLADRRSPSIRRLATATCDNSTARKFSQPHHGGATTSWLRTAQFTTDGTSLIAQSNDHKLHTFVLPYDLLDEEQLPHQLKPHATIASPSCMLSFAIYPGFELSDTNTTWVLTGENDVPVRLRNALDYDYASHSYPWYHPQTEETHAANSLLFVDAGAHFAVGTRGRLAIFDVERAGERCVTMHEFRKSTDQLDRGLVMGLAVSADGILAAGSSNRNISLWAKSGLGEVHGKPELSFQLTPPDGVADTCPGTGVTSMAWSACQRYLYVAERQSDCIQVFDVRTGGRRLSWMSQRNAGSSQKFDFSIRPGGTEVWAGGMDGKMRVWTNPGAVSGEHLPQAVMAFSDKPIGGTCWHAHGDVLTTTQGGRSKSIDEADDKADCCPFDTLTVFDAMREE
ncbi:hypothetical protein AMS68_004884 [Peltaster fructicola]|uniref:Anaphase-promoting complex subunit 4 WD40 domain-containing protein n=1 Tax=Peltaster fructicola TaxID=286661 RepID=A0A6H0XX67_9PEZI|nr:hypothetical protein AMS68_004884 [Peltaster fructicola]